MVKVLLVLLIPSFVMLIFIILLFIWCLELILHSFSQSIVVLKVHKKIVFRLSS